MRTTDRDDGEFRQPPPRMPPQREDVSRRDEPRADEPGRGAATAPSGPGFFSRMSRRIVGTVVIAIILYVGMMAISRTGGFAALVGAQLQKRLGMKFEVGSSALTPSFVLVLGDVRGEVSAHPLKPYVAARRVVMNWSLLRLLTGSDSPVNELRAEDVTMRFAPDAAGVWQPRPFNDVSRWLAEQSGLKLDALAALADLTAMSNKVAVVREPSDPLDLFAERRVAMTAGRIEWAVTADGPSARLEDVQVDAGAMMLRGREVKLMSLVTAGGTGPSGRLPAMTNEVIGIDGREMPLPKPPAAPPPVRAGAK